MSTTTTFTYTDSNGKQSQVPMEITEYKAAGESKLSLPQYMERRCNPLGIENPNGTAFQQAIHQAGLFMHADPVTGLTPPTMKDVLSDTSWKINAGAVVAPDGADRNTISGRYFFPAVIMEAMAAELVESNDPWISAFDATVAQTASVTSPRYDQPRIHTEAPAADEYRSQPMAQLAEPPALITITTSSVSRNIPTTGIGMLISDQALESSTLDLVGLAFSAQARGERIRRYEEDFAKLVNGDTDLGESAITAVYMDTFDSASVTTGAITHKAYYKWLYANYKKLSISDCFGDLDAALAVEGRTGRPTIATDDPNSPRIDAIPRMSNLAVPDPIFLGTDTAVVGANVIIGIDRRYAMRRVINVSASYQATESYVMRRAQAFIVTSGQILTKLYPEAWSKLILTATP